MRKLFNFLPIFLLVTVFFTSCLPEDEFDELLLIGKWRSGTEYYRYDTGGTGVAWDAAKSEDVTEEEAQPFTWTLEKSDLILIHFIGEVPNVPKPYTVTELTETSLKYKDDFNKSYSFTRVKS